MDKKLIRLKIERMCCLADWLKGGARRDYVVRVLEDLNVEFQAED